jgi:hypothetical protein
MRFNSEAEFDAWLDSMIEANAQRFADDMAADGHDLDVVAKALTDAREWNRARVEEMKKDLMRAFLAPDAPSLKVQ